jgi:hypothetical protein
MKKLFFFLLLIISLFSISCNKELNYQANVDANFLLINKEKYQNAPLNFEAIAPIVNDGDSIYWVFDNSEFFNNRFSFSFPKSNVDVTKNLSLKIYNSENKTTSVIDTSIFVKRTPDKLNLIKLSILSLHPSDSSSITKDFEVLIKNKNTNQSYFYSFLNDFFPCESVDANLENIEFQINDTLEVTCISFINEFQDDIWIEEFSFNDEQYISGVEGERYPSKLDGAKYDGSCYSIDLASGVVSQDNNYSLQLFVNWILN